LNYTSFALRRGRDARDARGGARAEAAVIPGDRQELKNAKVIPVIPGIVAQVFSPAETPRMIHRKLKQ